MEIAYQALIFEYNKQLAPNNRVASPIATSPSTVRIR